MKNAIIATGGSIDARTHAPPSAKPTNTRIYVTEDARASLRIISLKLKIAASPQPKETS